MCCQSHQHSKCKCSNNFTGQSASCCPSFHTQSIKPGVQVLSFTNTAAFTIPQTFLNNPTPSITVLIDNVQWANLPCFVGTYAFTITSGSSVASVIGNIIFDNCVLKLVITSVISIGSFPTNGQTPPGFDIPAGSIFSSVARV